MGRISGQISIRYNPSGRGFLDGFVEFLEGGSVGGGLYGAVGEEVGEMEVWQKDWRVWFWFRRVTTGWEG